MNDAILTARHARRTVNAAYLPYMSPATGKSAEESTHTIVDTLVSDSVICVLYGPRNLRHIMTTTIVSTLILFAETTHRLTCSTRIETEESLNCFEGNTDLDVSSSVF